LFKPRRAYALARAACGAGGCVGKTEGTHRVVCSPAQQSRRDRLITRQVHHSRGYSSGCHQLRVSFALANDENIFFRVSTQRRASCSAHVLRFNHLVVAKRQVYRFNVRH